MSYMFAYCEKLPSLDLSGFNTANVTSMFYMFSNCHGLKRLDLGSFNTAKVQNMASMLSDCDHLQTIYVGDEWSIASLLNPSGTFTGCTSLVGGQGTAYSADHVNGDYAHIDGGPSNPGYFTDKNAALRGDVNGNGSVNISDATALADYLLNGDASGINPSSADCNQDSRINISDLSALVDYLLNGSW